MEITKCSGDNCPHKENCYRFTAEAEDMWESYFVEPPIKDGKCDHYLGANGKLIWNNKQEKEDDKH